MRVKEYVLGEYQSELDTIGPGFRDIQYPALLIMLEDGTYVVYDWNKLDRLFSGVIAAKTAQSIANKARQNHVVRLKK